MFIIIYKPHQIPDPGANRVSVFSRSCYILKIKEFRTPVWYLVLFSVILW